MNVAPTQDYRFLGAFRLLLAWMVLTSHANHYLPAWVAPLALGNVGVFSFFVLSGFVIAEACDRFYAGAPHRFLLNRLLRIYPTYWLTCVLALAIYVPLGHPELQLDAASIAANLAILVAPQGTFFWISLIWAVGIELRFYFVAALMSLAHGLVKRPVLVHALFWVGALVLYLVTVASDYQRLATFRHAPYFVFGVALYHFVAYRGVRAALAAAGAFPFVLHAYWAYNAAGPTALPSSTLVFVATLAAMVALCFVTIPIRAARVDKLLGDLTYPLYLVHWPIVWLVGQALPGAGFEGYLAVALASLAAAGLVLLMEQPLTRLRDRVRRRRLYA
jgi:peptidoglycan/LPS O-acetylase OafA/YrhL